MPAFSRAITALLTTCGCTLSLAALAQTPPAAPVVVPPDAPRSQSDLDPSPDTPRVNKYVKPPKTASTKPEPAAKGGMVDGRPPLVAAKRKAPRPTSTIGRPERSNASPK